MDVPCSSGKDTMIPPPAAGTPGSQQDQSALPGPGRCQSPVLGLLPVSPSLVVGLPPQPGAGELVLGVRRLASLQSERCHGNWHFPTEDFPLGGGAAGCPASLGSLHRLCAHVPVLAGAQHAFCCSAALSRGRVTPWGPPISAWPLCWPCPMFQGASPFLGMAA